MKYLEMMHLFHDFSRSIRKGDSIATISTNSKFRNYLFKLNHILNARWFVKYHDNLLKVSEMYSELYKKFLKRFFGFKRKCKIFSRIP